MIAMFRNWKNSLETSDTCLPKLRIRALFIALFLALPSSAAQLTKQQWLQDIDELVAKIEQYHPDPYHHYPQQQFYHEVRSIKDSINNEKPVTTTMAMMQLVSKLRDRHTVLHPLDPNGFNDWLPIYIYSFEDGFYVVSTLEKYQNLLGKKLISINGTDISDIFELTTDLHPSDNDIGRTQNTYYLSSMQVLEVLGIADALSAVTVTYKDANDSLANLEVTSINIPFNLNESLFWGEMYGPMDEAHYDQYTMAFQNLKLSEWRNKSLAEKQGIPQFLRHRRGYWYEYIADKNAMYVAINYSTHNGRNGFDSFRAFLDEVFGLVDQKPIDKFILDIRFNPGGDGSTTLPLVHEIIKRDKINQYGKLFTLTGRKTYSAAQMIYAEMLKHTNTLLVGEPAGAPVNGYGDPGTFSLSNSGMQLHISTLYWQMGHPADDSWLQVVDLPFVFSGKEYVAGQDRALNYLLNLERPYQSLPSILINRDLPSFNKAYQERRSLFAKYSWWKPFDEREMRYAARDLYDQGEMAKGKAGFEALTELYPQSWRAWRDYARRVLKTGDKQHARQLLEKGIAINPGSRDLQQLLADL